MVWSASASVLPKTLSLPGRGDASLKAGEYASGVCVCAKATYKKNGVPDLGPSLPNIAKISAARAL